MQRYQLYSKRIRADLVVEVDNFLCKATHTLGMCVDMVFTQVCSNPILA